MQAIEKAVRDAVQAHVEYVGSSERYVEAAMHSDCFDVDYEFWRFEQARARFEGAMDELERLWSM